MNLRRKRIICATDLLPRSEAAMERAGLLADAVGADLTLLHVVVPSHTERGLEQVLRQAQSTLRSRAQFPKWRAARLPEISIRAGNPARVVLDEVTAGSGADLLVLGRHRRRPVRDVLEGTIAEKILASRISAVLVVHARPEAQYRRVLLALDVSPSSAGAIRAAEQLILSENATATIIHADEPPFQRILKNANVELKHIERYVRDWRAQTTQVIRNLVRRESEDVERFGIHIEAGNTVHGILRAVERYSPELLLMGTRGGGRLHRALLGSVANSVIHRVACDVMVVPEGTFQALKARPHSAVHSPISNVTSSTAGALR